MLSSVTPRAMRLLGLKIEMVEIAATFALHLTARALI
jgi:hypothetical protein